MKKYWLFIVFAIASGILIYLLFQVARLKDYDHNDASLKAIPSNAGVIIKARSFEHLQKKLNEEINFKAELFTSSRIREVLAPLTKIDSFATNNEIPISRLKQHPLYISFHGEGKQSVSIFYLLELKNKKEAIQVEKALDSGSSGLYRINKRKYNSQGIYHIQDPAQSQSLYISFTNGLVLISESSLLIEASIRQLSAGEDWSQDPSFVNVKKTASAASNINVFLHFNALPEIFNALVNPAFNKQLELLREQSEWAELDMDIKDDGILLNGFLSGKSNGVYAHLFRNTKAQRKSYLEYLPVTTKAYLSVILDNGTDLQRRLSEFYSAHNSINPITRFEKQHNIDFQTPFYSILSGELSLAIEGPGVSGTMLMLGLKSKSEGEAVLKQLLQSTGHSPGPAHTYRPDDGVSYPIYKAFAEPVFEQLFGCLATAVPNAYFTIYQNNLVVADQPRQLEQFIYNNILNRTLKYDKTHQKFLENFASRDNLFIYANLEWLPQSTGNIFKPIWQNISTAQKEALSSFYAMAFQFSGMGSMAYSTLYLQHLPNKISEPHTIWQSLLDTIAITKPTLIDNHYTNEKEVMIQDANNNLYLMGNNGRMLWKKPLDAPILSEIIQIDYYANNKYQYVFNTKNRLYILDRNGNHVANFPVNLPSPATNGVAVMDYDNNKDYRFFIACENKNVYLYDKKGNQISGWEFKGSEGIVSTPVQHFRAAGKDYIVVSDNRRNYILNRKGNIRVPLKADFVKNPESEFFLSGTGNNTRLITSSANGEIVKVSLDNGSVTRHPLGKVGGKHRLAYKNINGRERYILSEPHQVKVMDGQYSTLFNEDFKDEINLNVDIYQFSSQNIKFGVSELHGNRIFLMNDDGSLYHGFPLLGKSRFSIGFLKSSSTKFNLIVAGVNNYLYNYRVE